MATFDLSSLNKGQHEVASRLDEPLFVSAGAGSGKTYTLTARLVHALSEGSATDGGRYLHSIDEALVITFTEAAALEIKERVRQALRSAGDEDALLREESLKVDSAWISTIHGMCSRILHRHAVELGIDPKFTVCTGSVQDALMAQALNEVMQEVTHDDAYAALREQYDVWSAGSSSVAGIVQDLMGEANKSIRGFDGIRCPQSYETAAAVVRFERSVEALSALKLTEKQRATVDAALAAAASFTQLAPGERTPEAACEALANVKLPDLRKADQKPLKDEAKRALAEVLVCAAYEQGQEFAPQLVALACQVNERYGELKRAYSYLDNDDLITLALDAVKSSADVARDYAGRFRLVMIDEFQDTDQKQLELISLLSGEDACHLTTVGDAQQSIYRFRGGDVEVFLRRGRTLPKASHVEMDVNYRSDPSVLAVVERACGDAELLRNFLKLAGDAERKSKYAAAVQGKELPRIRLEVAAGGTSELMSATLAAQIADRLAEYRDAGQAVGSMALLLGTTPRVGLYLDALRARGLPAVVTGGSSFSSTPEVRVVQALLHTLANPHDTQTGLFPLLSSDMFQLDADDFVLLGTRTQEKLPAPTKRRIEQCFVDGELVLFGDAEPSARLRLAHAVLSRAFARMGTWQLADVCQAVVEESGWLARLERKGLDGLGMAANVLAAVRYVRELTGDLGLGVARAATEFDQWLAAAKLTPKNLVGDMIDAVQVMTVHGSKGLQFAVTAVSECWGKPSMRGALTVGEVGDERVVCVKPSTDIKNFSAMRKQVVVPDGPESCTSVADWALYLEDAEVKAQEYEKARLLYVALTRAEEALVVGVPVAEKEGYRSDLAMGFLGAFPELDELGAGEYEIDVAPASPLECERRIKAEDGSTRAVREPAIIPPGVARVVLLEHMGKAAADPWSASAAGTLAGFEGVLPDSFGRIAVLGTDADQGDDAQEADAPTAEFHLFAQDVAVPSSYGWRAREGVFSYSSAHALMEEQTKAAPAEERMPEKPRKAQQEAEAEGASYTPDTDKATNLGSAFHELAQTMVETGRDHDPARLDALARYWRLSQRQRTRLEQAAARWERCDLRREALAHDMVRAEVPFFIKVDAQYGTYVEGAIDLLCRNAGSQEALVVDYKTGDVGLTLQEVYARHEMQANFYAYVMMSQGYARVSCAFVCVECDDGAGQPVVVRYEFDEDHRPHI